MARYSKADEEAVIFETRRRIGLLRLCFVIVFLVWGRLLWKLGGGIDLGRPQWPIHVL
jgi:hypothetical protein